MRLRVCLIRVSVSLHTSVTSHGKLWVLHAAADGMISFFFAADWHPTVCMAHVCAHSSVNVRLGCVHVLAVLNSAAVNVGVHAFLELQFCLNIRPGVGLQAALFLVFKGTSILVSTVAVPVYISTSDDVGRSPFLHTLSSASYL